ncbi:XRE family transcriptional regulator [Alteromonadaceae bacterium M269]|nr:XRE family transcriptional regulator [Alteromonadaceae bacterium M269]
MHECRKWRQFRKLSQLELALTANISQRHISYLETGRSQPSREMVVQLADALDVPLRERNVMLQAAGFSALYNESQMDDPVMAPIMKAVKRVLEHHNPLPAIVVDRFWDVQMMNASAERLFGLIMSSSDFASKNGEQAKLNVAELTLHPKGLRQFITNWEQAAPSFVSRLKSEMLSSANVEVRQRLGGYLALASSVGEFDSFQPGLLPVMPLNISVSGVELSFFSMISTIGTPQDITTDELRIESFYPNDEATEVFFRSPALS